MPQINIGIELAITDAIMTTTYRGPLSLINQLLPQSKATTPAINVYEDSDGYTIELEAPGTSKEDFKISFQEGVLHVSGATKEDAAEGKTCIYRERYAGRFVRSLALPERTVADKISAAYQNGILSIRIPKAEEAKPKQIEVTVQ